MSSVYKIMNNDGDTIYVGISRRNVVKRFDEHIHESKKLSLFTKRELTLGLFHDELNFEVVRDGLTV